MKMLHNLPGALPNNYTFDLRIVIGKDPQCVLKHSISTSVCAQGDKSVYQTKINAY